MREKEVGLSGARVLSLSDAAATLCNLGVLNRCTDDTTGRT